MTYLLVCAGCGLLSHKIIDSVNHVCQSRTGCFGRLVFHSDHGSERLLEGVRLVEDPTRPRNRSQDAGSCWPGASLEKSLSHHCQTTGHITGGGQNLVKFQLLTRGAACSFAHLLCSTAFVNKKNGRHTKARADRKIRWFMQNPRVNNLTG